MNAIAGFESANSGILKVRGADRLQLVYTYDSPQGACYYIFNKPSGEGFVVASADDRLPSVLGFTDNGSFEPGKENDNLKWWLGEYGREISSFLEADPQVESYVPHARPLDNAPIDPICTTKWDQGTPYNALCPYDSRAHALSVTGCVATAMAQVMKAHNWPDHPTGQKDGYIFNNTTLDWANMIDVYDKGKYTQEQQDAVALLMRQCGASVSMMYSAYASGAYENDVQVAWRQFFGYDQGLELHYRDYYNYSQWNKMVYDELSTNGPVFYCGQSSAGGHAFVCDGYLGNSFYHFNWGWGGYQDGYFVLSALNPATGGAGSSAGGYNARQSIITGLKKATGEAAHLQELAISSGSFTYKNNQFMIQGGEDNYNEIYNPLAYTYTANFGVKIVPFDGSGEPQYVSSGNKTMGRWKGFSSLNVTMPSLKDGKYKVSPAMRTSWGEWKDVGVPLSMQTYVTMEIKGGKASYFNDGAADAEQPKLLAGTPMLIDTPYGGAGQAIRVIVSNVGEGDFMGTLYMVMEDSDDPFGDAFGDTKWVSIPSNFTAEIDFTSDRQVVPGNYEVRIFDRYSNFICDGVPVVLKASDSPMLEELEYGELFIQDLQPRFTSVSPDGLGLVMKCVNKSKYDANLSLNVAFLDAKDFQPVLNAHGEGVVIDPKTTQLVNMPVSNFNLAPGSYYMKVTDKDGNMLTPLTPLCVESEIKEAGGVYYVVTSESAKTASVVAPPTEDYSGSVTVPAYIDGYCVKEIRANAFTFADGLKDASLPSTVDVLQSGTFYLASSMESVQIRSNTPPAVLEDVFPPKDEQNIVLYTPAGTANFYGHSVGWDVLAISNWTFNTGEGVEIVGGLLINPDTNEYYSPYYINGDESLQIEVKVPEGMYPMLEWTIGDSAPQKNGYSVNTIALPVLNGASAVLNITADDGSGVASLGGALQPGDVYSIDGTLVMRGAAPDVYSKLPKGLYIINGRKLKI